MSFLARCKTQSHSSERVTICPVVSHTSSNHRLTWSVRLCLAMNECEHSGTHVAIITHWLGVTATEDCYLDKVFLLGQVSQCDL